MLRAGSKASVWKWIALGVGGVLVLLVAILALIDWNRLKGPVERMASSRWGRPVKIEGPLEVHIWSWTPRARVRGLVVGNPPWEAGKPMARLESLDISVKLLPLLKGDVILPRVEFVHPQVYLHRDAQGRANWTFESAAPSNAKADEPPKLPVVRNFIIREGQLNVRDDLLKLVMDGQVEAQETIGTKEGATAFRIEGRGTLNAKTFQMQVSGGPLINLDPDRPYPFKVDVRAGDIRVDADGSVKKPFDLGRLAFDVHFKGGDLADLYYLTQLALPNTPPFEISAHVERDVKVVKVTELAGTLGKSDVRGQLTIDASRKRPSISGDLQSKHLRLVDLGAALGGQAAKSGNLQGAKEKPKPSAKGASEAPPRDPNARVFPTARLQVNRVRAMDADVRFKASAIEAGAWPLKHVAFRVQLDDGLLAIAPLEMTLPQGHLKAEAHIDARGEVPESKVEVRIQDVQLAQVKGKKPGAQPPLSGVMQARASLEGRGDSVHDVMAGANGRVSVVLPHGQVNEALAELTGINVARGLGLLIKGSDEKVEIRCGVAQFGIRKGTLHADQVVLDTENVKIDVDGEVRLGPEELDLSIKGKPKKLRLARLRTPVEIRGHLRDPHLGVDVGKTVRQGAVATAIGVALTPVAAIIAFIDPGLAKDENCAALLSTVDAATRAQATRSKAQE